MAENNFIENIVNDYEELGFGVKTEHNTLIGVDGEGELSLDPLLDERKDVVGVIVYSDGLNVGELNYEDENFNTELLKHVSSALNI